MIFSDRDRVGATWPSKDRGRAAAFEHPPPIPAAWGHAHRGPAQDEPGCQALGVQHGRLRAGAGRRCRVRLLALLGPLGAAAGRALAASGFSTGSAARLARGRLGRVRLPAASSLLPPASTRSRQVQVRHGLYSRLLRRAPGGMGMPVCERCRIASGPAHAVRPKPGRETSC